MNVIIRWSCPKIVLLTSTRALLPERRWCWATACGTILGRSVWRSRWWYLWWWWWWWCVSTISGRSVWSWFDLEVGGGGDLSDVLCSDFQAVPCPLSPEDCQWPTEFPELLDMRSLFNDDDGDHNCDNKDSKEVRERPAVESDQNKFRPGVGQPAVWEGRVCTRWFQGGFQHWQELVLLVSRFWDHGRHRGWVKWDLDAYSAKISFRNKLSTLSVEKQEIQLSNFESQTYFCHFFSTR